ncbi:MAG: hypothetical protein IJK96_06420 [Bacteroidales bacterium]|nr:hypothetical protein [Bacteroidales bacterium]
MPDYKIHEVVSKKDLNRFISFPDILYKDCPQYVPALHGGERKALTDGISTARYCPHKLWIVTDGKKVVGRICAIVNPRYIERFGLKRARFGWFDTIDDFEVAKLLIGTAEDWAREMGMDEIHGPLYYNTLGKQGMLVEGFENIPQFNTIYNFPYYNDFVTRLGYEKELDWLQYKMPACQDIPEKVVRVSKMLYGRYDLHEGSIDRMKKDPQLVMRFFDVYNESFAGTVNNFVPFTKEEMTEELGSVLPYLSDKTSIVILDKDDDLVAFAVCFPSISRALQKAKGHLFPFGWFHLLKALRNYRDMDLMLNGAVDKYQNTGVSSLLHIGTSERCHRNGSVWTVTNPQIEGISATNTWGRYDHEPYMRRRCYLKHL